MANALSLNAKSGQVVPLGDGSRQVQVDHPIIASRADSAASRRDAVEHGAPKGGGQIAGQPLRVKVNGATPTEIDTWASIAAVQSPADGSQAKLITPLGSFSPSEAIKLT